MVVVEEALRLARRQNGQVVAELLRANAVAGLRRSGDGVPVVFDVGERDFVSVGDRL